MSGQQLRFYLVQEDILPDAIYKTVQAKELLISGETTTVAEAVARVKLSRSAFYKYKDKVYPFHRWSKDQTVTMELRLEHKLGVLSAVLNSIAATGGNIVTINQNLPQQGMAVVTITIEITHLSGGVEQMLQMLQETKGVQEAFLLGT